MYFKFPLISGIYPTCRYSMRYLDYRHPIVPIQVWWAICFKIGEWYLFVQIALSFIRVAHSFIQVTLSFIRVAHSFIQVTLSFVRFVRVAHSTVAEKGNLDWRRQPPERVARATGKVPIIHLSHRKHYITWHYDREYCYNVHWRICYNVVVVRQPYNYMNISDVEQSDRLQCSLQLRRVDDRHLASRSRYALGRLSPPV